MVLWRKRQENIKDGNAIKHISLKTLKRILWLLFLYIIVVFPSCFDTRRNLIYMLYLGSVRKLGCKQQAYAHSFVNLKRKKGISATPLNWLLNAFTLALNDSAPALVCLFTK